MIDVSTWAKRLGDPMMEVYGKERFAQYWARWVDGMSQAAEENNMDICREWLKYIKCPTLVLHGGLICHLAEDIKFRPTNHSFLIKFTGLIISAAIVKNHSIMLRLHIYPDGKHDIHMRYTKDFNRRVQDFVLEENVADI
ncbi:valacyclovir hydrolase-like [Pararge aegeria]|uniref:valacyclovir hydrolase-like n=1 Tax=Pararge aegeria TaxID=116150 RepID=UPI0019D17B69|nr:valacyclovir hydrolase-like [Pararge aegeria]